MSKAPDLIMSAEGAALYLAISNLAVLLDAHGVIPSEAIGAGLLQCLSGVPEPSQPIYKELVRGIISGCSPAIPGQQT